MAFIQLKSALTPITHREFHEPKGLRATWPKSLNRPNTNMPTVRSGDNDGERPLPATGLLVHWSEPLAAAIPGKSHRLLYPRALPCGRDSAS